MDDNGNWSEPLGVGSMISEAGLIVLAGTCLLPDRRSEPSTV